MNQLPLRSCGLATNRNVPSLDRAFEVDGAAALPEPWYGALVWSLGIACQFWLTKAIPFSGRQLVSLLLSV